MILWPYGSTRARVDQLAGGDIVVVPGAGAYRIAGFTTCPGRTRLALLDWDDLALFLRPGTYRERLNPAPHAHHSKPAPSISPTTGGCDDRPALPLAG
ncbi:MAG: hypothetical protein GEV07_25910 [Streptosporangiales bacterium]|nr:hypothetical protein [Streptosporangiales bacterium]